MFVFTNPEQERTQQWQRREVKWNEGMLAQRPFSFGFSLPM
jgi:hypothetical protein